MSHSAEELASQILLHKKLYYKGKSIISDAEYDALENKLKTIDSNHPVLKFVGYDLNELKDKVEHTVPMLSLEKTYSTEDLFEYLQKYDCICIDKFDGMALSLEYDENFSLFRSSTRGNGKFGENVLERVYHIQSLPKSLSFLNSLPHLKNHRLEIRGEIYFPISSFRMFEDEFDSYRNAVPGTFGRKEVEEAVNVLRELHFCAYDMLIFDKNGKVLSAAETANVLNIKPFYSEKLHFLQEKLGFETHFRGHTKFQSFSQTDLEKWLHDTFHHHRNYQIDGLVFRIDDEIKWEQLGNTAHHPRGSIAFKQTGDTATTEILAIEENVGRSGKITFRAKLKPTYLSGATISYATLHNADFIEKGNYAPGAVVKIKRSGEVIPAIMSLESPAPEQYQLPTLCPCGFALTRNGPDLLCLEKRACRKKDVEALIHYASTLDIYGVSEKIIFKLHQAGILTEPADFYKITKEDFLQIEGFAEKSAQNALAAIAKTQKVPLALFLAALGLKRGGLVKCQEVAKAFLKLEAIRELEPAVLQELKGWAEKSAEDFLQSLIEKKETIDNILKYVKVVDEVSVKIDASHPLFGKHICITGTLAEPRDFYKSEIEKIGGKFVSGVTSKTDYLVCNESSTSSKYKDAVKLNIPIISEKELIAMLKAQD